MVIVIVIVLVLVIVVAIVAAVEIASMSRKAPQTPLHLRMAGSAEAGGTGGALPGSPKLRTQHDNLRV